MATEEIGAVWEGMSLNEAQPHPRLMAARRTCPVAQSAPLGLDPRPRFNITTWADVETVMHDAETYSSAICGESLDPFMGESILSRDGEEHRFQRRLLGRAFRAAALDRWERELIRPIMADLVGAVAPRGHADIRAEVLVKYPISVICGMYGVPLEDAGQFQTWANHIIHGTHDPEPAFAAGRAMRAYLTPILEERRAHPRDDLLSDLLTAELDGRGLTQEQIWGTLTLVLVGGADTTYQALGSLLVGLLERPELHAAVVADRGLIPAVVEESLRWEPPAMRTERLTTRDVTLGGCPIPAGSSLNVWLGSANRDEQHFADADDLVLDRGETRRHVTFGLGPHQCLGIHLARKELQIGLEVLLEALPGLRFDPAHGAPDIVGAINRGPRTLHLAWDSPSAG